VELSGPWPTTDAAGERLCSVGKSCIPSTSVFSGIAQSSRFRQTFPGSLTTLGWGASSPLFEEIGYFHRGCSHNSSGLASFHSCIVCRSPTGSIVWRAILESQSRILRSGWLERCLHALISAQSSIEKCACPSLRGCTRCRIAADLVPGIDVQRRRRVETVQCVRIDLDLQRMSSTVCLLNPALATPGWGPIVRCAA
jgi:hypothetical protein